MSSDTTEKYIEARTAILDRILELAPKAEVNELRELAQAYASSCSFPADQ